MVDKLEIYRDMLNKVLLTVTDAEDFEYLYYIALECASKNKVKVAEVA